MSQFGMQGAGGRIRRGASPDVYTAIVAIALVFLLAALAVMWKAGSTVGKGGPFGLQDPKGITFTNAPAASGPRK